MDNVDLLRQIPLFEGMTDKALDAVGELTEEVSYADGEPLVREGEAGDAFYMVVDGRLRVTRGGITIAEEGPGDFLGEISLIDGRPRTATVTAVGTVRALAIQRPDFMTLIDDHPAVRLSVLMALTERIRRDAQKPVI